MSPLTFAFFLCVTNALKFVPEENLQRNLQVQLPQGIVQGTLRPTIDASAVYYSFEGIPYAKPPVGRLRFRPPEEADGWQGVLNGTTQTKCVQIASVGGDENEDCLYLNVFAPSLQFGPEKRAVIVWIYGGGFIFGKSSRDYYGPDYLIQENVIVVSFNYRVNVFGFLSTGDLAAPGNYGLKDQHMALKWVRSNIGQFGGDAQRIAIFGESAGAASVHYHLLAAEKNRNLFSRAIASSGSALCPWAYLGHPLKIAKDVAAAAGFDGGSTRELVNYLRKISVKKLKRATNIAIIKNTVNYTKTLPFSPTIEPVHAGAYITEDSYRVLLNREFLPVPLLIGFNSQEAAGAQLILEKASPVLKYGFSKMGNNLVPPGIEIAADRIQDANEEIWEHYFGSASGTPTQQTLDFVSDSYFYRPIMETALQHSIVAPVYMYRFAYEGYYLGKKAMDADASINGVQHAEDVWYIFSRSDLKEMNDTDRRVLHRMTKMWTDFAKFGNPSGPHNRIVVNPTLNGRYSTMILVITSTLAQS